MSLLTLTRDQSRLIDIVAIEQFGIPGIVLMENAGRNCAEAIQKLIPQSKKSSIVIACGGGNNGGDGFVIARHLLAWSVSVKVVLFSDPARLTPDALVNYRILENTRVIVEVFDPDWNASQIENCLSKRVRTKASIFVDALMGTGAVGNPRPPLDRVIEIANGLDLRRVAIDIPTGLDCDMGVPGRPTLIADDTLTFVAVKSGFLNDQAAPYLGRVQVMEIGIPPAVIKRTLRSSD